MMPLYDMIANAQNGAGMEALARQFGLSREQTQAAVEALLPAFSQGLKRNVSDPYGMGAFLQAMSSGQHARYFEDPAQAFSQSGMSEGNGILGHLFGSKDLSRAVAGQAAMASGVGQEVLKQMLPVLASMIMGGLFKQSTGQMAAAPGAGGGLLGQIMEQMMRGGFGQMGGGAPQPQRQAAPNPMDNPFGQILEGMFGGGAAQRAPQPEPRGSANPMGDNPFGRMFEEMMRGGQRTETPAAEPRRREPEPEPNPSGRARNPYDDIFGQMFETGRRQRDDYQKGMESIFDQFVKGMDRHR